MNEPDQQRYALLQGLQREWRLEGLELSYTITEQYRIGDHICYISNLKIFNYIYSFVS